MDVKDRIVRGAMAAWSDEIERAIDNAKRTEMDKWWWRQFYKETGRMAKNKRRERGAGWPWRGGKAGRWRRGKKV